MANRSTNTGKGLNARIDGRLLSYARNTFVRGGGARDYPIPFSATGGTKSGPTGGYIFHSFTTPGPQPFTTNAPIPGARFILVAGGGSGAGGYGGGGGGGGVVYSNGTYTIESGDWIVEVGAGGPAPAASYTNGSKGSNSNFYKPGSVYPSPTYLRAFGGGEGYAGSGSGPGGSSGGSGSVPAPAAEQPTANPGVSGITNAGNVGGTAPRNAPGYSHGGGGGAGGVGESTSSATTSGRGGVGLGPPTWSWLPTSFGTNGYFAGGGGGSGYSSSGTPGNGLGSPDGTGGRAYQSQATNGEPGDTNTGGGGGAASTPIPGQPYNTSGGAGGPGVMIIAYPDSL